MRARRGRAGWARVAVAVAWLLLVGCGESLPEAVSNEPMQGAELGEALGGGGYVLYLRHATSDSSVDQGAPPEVTDCGRQRNLSRDGREQAERIGEAVDDLDIPVGEVLASPYCRTMQTAELALGEAIEEYRLLNGDDEAAVKDLVELLSDPPSRGNTWLVGHVSNIGAAADIDIPEGGTAVFAPGGDGEFALVATVPPDGWDELQD